MHVFTGIEWLGPIQLCSARHSLTVGHVIVSVTAEDCQYNSMTFKRYDVDRIDCTIVSIERYLYKSETALHIKWTLDIIV